MKPSIREWLEKNWDKYPTSSEAANACVAELSVTRKGFFNTLSELKAKGIVKPSLSAGGDARMSHLGLTEREFRAKHDSLYKLEQAVAQLLPGKFVPEAEFRSTIAVDPGKFRAKADLPQFESYKGRAGNIVYWGHPKDIQRLKEEGVLS